MALDGVKQYLAANFAEIAFSDSEIEQLSWSIRSSGNTPEKAMIDVAGSPDFMEVRRCASRLYGEQSLVNGDYAAFIQNQDKEDEYCPVLEEGQFEQLSQKFRKNDQLTRDALRVTTIISSVPLSPKARERADNVLGKNNYTIDSVEFLADTFKDIENAKAIYPLVAELFKKYPAAKDQARISKLLKAAFPSRRHYRHMLYTEGNETLFDELIEGVLSGRIDKEQFDFWVQHWTINICGFRGHLSPKGSLYLTRNTCKAMQALESSLARIFNEAITSKEVLNDYLDKRWQGLQLGDIPERQLDITEKRLLAHIAAMMRLFHPEEGQALLEGYRFIPKATANDLKEVYFTVPKGNEPTPTYAPALYENGIDFRKEGLKNEDSILNQIQTRFFGNKLKKKAQALIRLVAIADVVVGLLPLNLVALKEYRKLREQNKIAANQPLSFAELAKKKEVIELLGESPIFKRFNILNQAQITVAENGTVAMRVKPKGKDKLKEPQAPIAHQYKLRTRKEPVQRAHAAVAQGVKIKVH
ncbi:MAG: hypothetical protein AB7I18_10940 [Candidatus Berkiella sp.]